MGTQRRRIPDTGLNGRGQVYAWAVVAVAVVELFVMLA